MIRYIYRLHDNDEKWCYIGSTCSVKRRLDEHKKRMRHMHQSDSQSELYRKISIIGCNVDSLCLDILEQVNCVDSKSVKSSELQEQKWIDYYISEGHNVLNTSKKVFVDEDTTYKIGMTNLSVYGTKNGGGGMPEAYDTNRRNHGGVLAFNTDTARVNNEFSRLAILYYDNKLFSGFPSLHKYLISKGYDIPLSSVHKVMTRKQSSFHKYPKLVNDIFLFPKGSKEETKAKEYIMNNYNDLSVKVFDVNGGGNMLFNIPVDK